MVEWRVCYQHFPKEIKEHYHTEHKSLKGTEVSSAIGGTLGAIVGAVTAIGSTLVVPRLGLLVAGPIAGGLAGVGAGG